IQGTIADSVAADTVGGTSSVGFEANGPGVKVALVSSNAVNNAIGLASFTSATMSISKTTVSGNTTNGFQISGATLQTFGDNYISDTNNVGALTPIAEQ